LSSSPPRASLKRPYGEIADSDAEDADSEPDYGWAESDELAVEGFINDSNNDAALCGSTEGTAAP